jgi:hypothetical protein
LQANHTIVKEPGLSESKVRLVAGVTVESVGEECVVMRPSSAEVIHLKDEAALLALRAAKGEQVVGPSEIVQQLVQVGVLEPMRGVSRRGLVKAGVIGAGTGVAVMAMPGAAAASSGPTVLSADYDFSLADWRVELVANPNPVPPAGFSTIFLYNFEGLSEIDVEDGKEQIFFEGDMLAIELLDGSFAGQRFDQDPQDGGLFFPPSLFATFIFDIPTSDVPDLGGTLRIRVVNLTQNWITPPILFSRTA